MKLLSLILFILFIHLTCFGISKGHHLLKNCNSTVSLSIAGKNDTVLSIDEKDAHRAALSVNIRNNSNTDTVYIPSAYSGKLGIDALIDFKIFQKNGGKFVQMSNQQGYVDQIGDIEIEVFPHEIGYVYFYPLEAFNVTAKGEYLIKGRYFLGCNNLLTEQETNLIIVIVS